ncbi:MAG: nucleotide excision repair endonuclease [bacterium]
MANSGGQASALAIAQKVLRLTHATPVIAERVLSSLLQNDQSFASDGMGNWHSIREKDGNEANPLVQGILVATPMQSREILRSRSIVLAWTVFSESSCTPIATAEIVLAPACQFDEGIYPRLTRAEFVTRFAAQFKRDVLVAWQPYPVTQALRRVFVTEGEFWFPASTVSLAVLARNLLGLNRPPALPGLYRQLCGAQAWRESFADLVQAQAEILRVLLAKCHELGLDDWSQIATLARRPRRADFTSYAFDKTHVDSLPALPGVYVMRDTKDHVVYVGKAANLRSRVRGYFHSPGAEDLKLQQLRSHMFTLNYKTVETELDALLLEHRLIRRLRPEINRQKRVFPSPRPQSERLQSIFLIPVHTSSPPATKGRVIVYLLSPQSLQRLSVRIGRKPGKRLHRALSDFHAEVVRSALGSELGAELGERLEIAARWLQQNVTRINVLDPADCDDLQELENRLYMLLRSPEMMTGKFCFTAVHPRAVRAEA